MKYRGFLSDKVRSHPIVHCEHFNKAFATISWSILIIQNQQTTQTWVTMKSVSVNKQWLSTYLQNYCVVFFRYTPTIWTKYDIGKPLSFTKTAQFFNSDVIFLPEMNWKPAEICIYKNQESFIRLECLKGDIWRLLIVNKSSLSLRYSNLFANKTDNNEYNVYYMIIIG